MDTHEIKLGVLLFMDACNTGCCNYYAAMRYVQLTAERMERDAAEPYTPRVKTELANANPGEQWEE